MKLDYCKARFKYVVGAVTFAEFAQYVAESPLIGRSFAGNWYPQHLMCNPCYMKYDFIGRFENMKDDAKHVISKLTTPRELLSNTTFPIINVSYSKLTAFQLREKFYATVPRDIVRKLISIYRLDYELFGYDFRWVCNDC